MRKPKINTDVVRRARGGDPSALATLYEAHADALYAVAFHITDSSADAQDVLQDVFVALPVALVNYEGRAPLGAWLRSIAVRTALMRLRARRSRREVRLPSTLSLGLGSAPRSPLDSVELERAIAGLSPKLRAVFVLRELEGLTHSEIAEALGISRSASEVRLYRARKKLQSALLSSRPH